MRSNRAKSGEALRIQGPDSWEAEREAQGQAESETRPRRPDSTGAWERGGGSHLREAGVRDGSWGWSRSEEEAGVKTGPGKIFSPAHT